MEIFIRQVFILPKSVRVFGNIDNIHPRFHFDEKHENQKSIESAAKIYLFSSDFDLDNLVEFLVVSFWCCLVSRVAQTKL